MIGLGEAGAAIARDLVEAGCDVRAWDADPARAAPGVALARDAEEAIADATLVLSLVGAAGARDVAAAAAGSIRRGTVFADLNTGTAVLKQELATTIEAAGGLFADVAVMAPVPGRGLGVPLLASGRGAEKLAALLRPLGAQIELLPGGPGAAATRKLIRSVFMKGLAAALLEAEAAARAAGCESWLHADVTQTLTTADAGLVDRLLAGSRTHADRRIHELEAAAALLRELGVPPHVTEAAAQVLREIADS